VIEPGDPYGFDWSFVALERRFGLLQRVYRVFVGDRLLCGAVVRAPVLVPLWPRAGGWDDPEQWIVPRRLSRYDGVNVTSPYFLRRARGNFHISRARIAAAELEARTDGIGRLRHSGVLRLRMAHGRPREFVLLGRQDAEAIRNRLQPLAR
jgi:hypothetical protein